MLDRAEVCRMFADSTASTNTNGEAVMKTGSDLGFTVGPGGLEPPTNGL